MNKDHTTAALIRMAALHDVDLVAPLFDSYRRFYDQDSDLPQARRFLSERIEQKQSAIFVAVIDGCGAGFVQLYPTFSSVAMRRVWILNDLFVSDSFRRNQLGTRLLQHTVEFAKNDGAVRLVLATGVENVAAQTLYEGCDWKRDNAFVHFEFVV